MILVVGTGRSGTSEVARLLEGQGVTMGHAFHMPDKFNPRGYFEDREFQSLNLSFYLMHLDNISEEDDPKRWKQWRGRFNALIESREEPWGLKDPGIADFPALLNEYLKLNPAIIYCTRDKEDTIQSLMRFKQKPREEMEKIYNQRTQNIEQALKNREHLLVDCYDNEKDREIEAWYNKMYV